MKAFTAMRITWHCHAIHSDISLPQQAAENALHLSGGDIFSFPAKCVPAAVTEVHVAKVIHDKYVA